MDAGDLDRLRRHRGDPAAEITPIPPTRPPADGDPTPTPGTRVPPADEVRRAPRPPVVVPWTRPVPSPRRRPSWRAVCLVGGAAASLLVVAMLAGTAGVPDSATSPGVPLYEGVEPPPGQGPPLVELPRSPSVQAVVPGLGVPPRTEPSVRPSVPLGPGPTSPPTVPAAATTSTTGRRATPSTSAPPDTRVGRYPLPPPTPTSSPSTRPSTTTTSTVPVEGSAGPPPGRVT